MSLQAVQKPLLRRANQQPAVSDSWKNTVSELLKELSIIPERFNGKVVVSFKDGGISYLEKSETFK